MNTHKHAFNIILTVLFLIFAQLGAQKKFVIVLDAGHGGSDVGATRKYENIGLVHYSKFLNLMLFYLIYLLDCSLVFLKKHYL